MKGRVFLHVGPPKTATTALQLAFEDLRHPKYVFGGTFQPRVRNKDSLADVLVKATGGDGEAAATVIERVKNSLVDGDIVLISEEMLSLEQKAVPMCEKIERLGAIFRRIRRYDTCNASQS